jgi:hypothetical protein
MSAGEFYRVSNNLKKEGPCYDHIAPRDGNTHSFSKEQTQGGASAPKGSAQDRSVIRQAPDKCQGDLLPRQRNDESLSQAQTPREWENRRLREGRVRSEYR